MPEIKCFFLEPTGRTRYYIIRSRWNETCPLSKWGHDARVLVGDFEAEKDEDGYPSMKNEPVIPHDDPRWPRQCECGAMFTEADPYSCASRNIYRRTDTGEEIILSDAPPGAMWNASWQSEYNGMGIGADGISLHVRTPGGDWNIDSRASNCTLPEDNKHRCWVRFGIPPEITVGKDGLTCSAGAGSIQCGTYHGFLRGGKLVDG